MSIRVQTTKPHFDLFLPGMNVKENVFFSLEREFRKALRDTLMRAAWYELLSTMANCGQIVTFLCLGISIITWVIILKQLIASGSWILVIIIRCVFFFLSTGWQSTTWPASNCLQIMVCSCVIPSKRVLLQIIFCSCVIGTTK